MMLEEGLYQWLTSDEGVKASASTRVYPLKAPQAKPDKSDFPHVTFQRIGTESIKTQDGVPTLVKASGQIDSWGFSLHDAKRLAARVRQSKAGGSTPLDGYRGNLKGVTVRGAWCNDERDDPVPPIHADDVGFYRVSQDWLIWYEEQTV